MARRKKFLKLPFFKFKINKNTWANIIGFIIGGFALLLLLSYAQSGEVLTVLNLYLTNLFGFAGILVPVVLFLLASHFFNTKKLKIIKPNITVGALLIFLSLLTALQSGRLGYLIFFNLQQDFSLIGTILIVFLMMLIGLILFLNTSIDSFLIFIVEMLKSLFKFAKEHVLKEFLQKKGKKQEKTVASPSDVEFVKDPILAKNAAIGKPAPMAISSDQDLNIRSLSVTSSKDWVYPPLSLLEDVSQASADRGDVQANCDTIEKTLQSFGISAKIAEVNEGPTVTQYALQVGVGQRLAKITALSNDLALALAARTGQVRIEAPIPGRSLVGIEIPNKRAEIVTLKKLLSGSLFTDSSPILEAPMGLDVSGSPVGADISAMPHILIAGTTGAGKSVLLNSWICTYLFRTKPQELRLILVDPKRVEFTLYNGIPHLLTEVIVEQKQIISALKWTVAEMENRYKIFAQSGQRNLASYNSQPGVEQMPHIVFIIDELADLMTYAARDAEELITRIAQMARATGIHLVLATQRPSVDVITGLMKANIPARVAFNVASMIDSRVVLDLPGAEKLLGRGDMLFLPPDQAKPRRIQGPYISEHEVKKVIDFLKSQTPQVQYTEEVTSQDVSVPTRVGGFAVKGSAEARDPLFDQAVEIVFQDGKGSASLLQRRLSIGYARAARILDELHQAGIVGPSEGSKPREVIKRPIQDAQPEV